jgi:hypothetical protein
VHRIRAFSVVATIVSVVAAGLLIGPVAASAAASNPVGTIDYADWGAPAAPYQVTMRGWVFDRDDLAAKERVDIYQTAPTAHGITGVYTSIYRPDVNRVFGITGTHGWAVSFTAPAGLDTFCAYGINLGAGTNTLIGCDRVLVPQIPSSAPAGRVDTATVSGSTLTMTGWAFDRDDLVTPEAVDVWQSVPTSARLGRTYTTIYRPDVNRVYSVFSSHGWRISVAIHSGTRTFCAYAINVGPPRPNVLIGCKTVTS